jgi:luciferase family oxidoreductase group 1
MAIPLSILDLALIGRGQTAGESFAASVRLAKAAEAAGYRRVWYAEHHGIGSIASSAPAVLIAHIAAHTKSIRLGAGGVMLPNHAPLVVAEQFGTLAELHPNRIDLGLGRAPGGDEATMHALRRYSADTFPDDVLELQAFLAGESLIPGVEATPGKSTHVPLYILGSSLFGARLAAALGLPFGFASHFAPQSLHDAAATYRREFRPGKQLDQPHLIAGLNVIVDETTAAAQAQFQEVKRFRARALLGRGRAFTDAETDALLQSPAGERINAMGTYSAIGTPAEVRAYVEDFARHSGADELITVHPSPDIERRLRSVEWLAGSTGEKKRHRVDPAGLRSS